MGQGFGLVSLCLERILGDFVPNTVSEGRLGLGQDNFNFFVGWVGQNWFRFGLVQDRAD